MKKILLSVISSAIFLSSCMAAGNPSSESEKAMKSDLTAEYSKIESELKTSSHLIGYDGGGFVCDGGGSLYFVTQAYAHSMIIEYDKSSGTGAPLCKNEGCTHDEPGCDANVTSGNSKLAYSDGKLYWMEANKDGAHICCEDVKTAVRAEIKSLPNGGVPAVWDVIFRGGKAFYYVAFFGGDAGAYIGIADLNGEEDMTVLDGANSGILSISLPANVDIQLLGEALYIISVKAVNQSDPNSDINVGIYKYNLSGSELAEVISFSSAEGDIPKASGFKLVSENDMYFMSNETRKICRYDIAEKTCAELFDFSEYGSTYGFTDGEIRDFRIFDDICCAVSVKDKKMVLAAKNLAGELIFETDISEFFGDEGGHPSVWIAGSDSENIYVCYTYQDAGYTYQMNKTVAVPVDGGEPKLLCSNRSSLLKRWH